jgi:membrane fusion protein (multidrug efflux system)
VFLPVCPHFHRKPEPYWPVPASKESKISPNMVNTQITKWFAVCLGVALLSSCQQKAAPPPPPPPEVGVSTAVSRDVTTYGDWVATLDGYVNAQIAPQVSGYLIKQDYREGSVVSKGQVLFEIDPRPFQAVLDQAKGQLAQAQGQLAQAQAALALAVINLNRDTPLVEARAVARSQLDTDKQTKVQDEASVAAYKAAIQTAQAQVEQAELNLGFTKVRSLVDGVAGIAAIQIGNLVSTSSVLTTVSQVNPIKAYFPISEQEYLKVSRRINPGPSGDWLKNSSAVPLQLTLADGTIFGSKGRIVFADRNVDSQTGTIRIVGAFPNAGNVLRPGQYGKVRAETGVDHDMVLVPQRAVSEVQGGYQVAVVGGDNKVTMRNVKVGSREGEMWVIASGIKAGEKVISEGAGKVRDGMTVTPKADSFTSQGS